MSSVEEFIEFVKNSAKTKVYKELDIEIPVTSSSSSSSEKLHRKPRTKITLDFYDNLLKPSEIIQPKTDYTEVIKVTNYKLNNKQRIWTTEEMLLRFKNEIAHLKDNSVKLPVPAMKHVSIFKYNNGSISNENTSTSTSSPDNSSPLPDIKNESMKNNNNTVIEFVKKNGNEPDYKRFTDFFNDNNYRIYDPEGDGDCFFYVVEEALDNPSITVTSLRQFLSGKINNDQLNIYLHDENQTWMKNNNIKSLPDLKAHVLKIGGYYADEFAISEIEKEYNIKFIIFSEKDKETNVLIKCLNDVDIKKNTMFILTSYTGIHYRLITYKNKKIFTFNELPEKIKTQYKNDCRKDLT
jgi:hypothetical protein